MSGAAPAAAGGVDRAFRAASNALALAGLSLLLLNSIATVCDILLRALFRSPIDRLSDVSTVLYVLAAAACLPAATVQRRHITIRAFEARLRGRGHAALECFATALLLLTWGVIAWQAWSYAQEMRATGQTLSQIGVSVAPIWYAVAVAMTFNALGEGANLAHWIRRLGGAAATGPEPEPETTGNIL